MRYIKKVIFIILTMMLLNNVYSETATDKLGLDEYVSTIQEHIDDSELGNVFDAKTITQDLMSGKGIQYNTMLSKLLGLFFKEVFIALKGAINIIIIIILIALIKNLEIQER